MKSPVIKRSVILSGHKTSVSLEDAFWEGLREIAQSRRMGSSALIGMIDGQRRDGNLSSAIRLFVLDHFRALAGPKQAGHKAREGEGAADEAGLAARALRGPGGARPPGFRRWA